MKGLVRIYNNFGHTWDQYTVVYLFAEFDSGVYAGRTVSRNGVSPQAIGVLTQIKTGTHLGEITKIEDLPQDVQNVIHRDIRSYKSVRRQENATAV